MLNSLVQSPPWDKVWAVALLKPLDNHMTEMLSHHGYNVDVSLVKWKFSGRLYQLVEKEVLIQFLGQSISICSVFPNEFW